MDKYSDILEDKKKYEEPVINTNKKFPWLKIDIILLSILLLIGYFIYYTIILSPKLIFISDIKILIDKYDDIIFPLEINKINDNYGILGNIKLKDKDYNFELDKIDKEFNFILGVDDKNLNYYFNDDKNYVKVSNSDVFYEKNYNNYFNMISNLKEYFKNISEDKFIKKFYLSGTTPVVESNIELNNVDIIEALKPNYYDSTYQLLFTFKNNAITNEIISLKIIINNLMTNERGVLFYENGNLIYKSDKVNLKFELEKKDKDFTLKIYKSDILFSTLSGVKKDTSYLYSYQVIDKVYTINLNISKENDLYYYNINSIIEKSDVNNENNLNISFQYLDPVIDNDITNSINYSSLTEDEKDLYKATINSIIKELGKIIK